MPALYALYIINKSGGMIYNKVCTHPHFTPLVRDVIQMLSTQEFLPMAGLNLNDTLRLASIW